jgi:hypothetical protein
MPFILRMVVLEASGKPGIILERRHLKARTLAEAKIEADSTPWSIDGIAPTGFEITDAEGATVARRRYAGPNVYGTWTNL